MNSHLSRLASSAFFLLSTRLIHRSLGLISTLILARVLTPKDFGVVAISAILVQLFNALAISGSDIYIIQKKNVYVDDLNTAWTIDFTLKSLLWLILFVFSEELTLLITNEDVTGPVRVLSFMLLMDALQNPGLIMLRRALNYKKIFFLHIIFKILSFLAVVSVAIIYESYWAMIVGDLVSSGAMLVGSYFIHNHRPSFTLKKIKQQISFSQWVLFKSIIGYCRSQIDNAIVSKSLGTVSLGRYNMAREIGLLASNEIVRPICEPMLASFASMKDNPCYLNERVRITLITLAGVATIIASYVFYFSQEIVAILLGGQWADVHGALSNFSFLFFFTALGLVLSQVLAARGRVSILFFYDLFSLIMFALYLILTKPSTIDSFSMQVSLISGFCTFVLYFVCAYVTGFKATRTFLLVLPIFCVPVVVGYFFSLLFQFDSLLLRFFVTGTLHTLFSSALLCLMVYVLSPISNEYRHIKQIILQVAKRTMLLLKD